MSCSFPRITIWSLRAYGCSLFRFLLASHLRLHSYISLAPFFENNLSPYLFRILLEPTFVCSCRDISSTQNTAAATTTTTTNLPKDQEGGGLHRPSMISPLRNSLTPCLPPPSFLFPVYSPSLVSRDILYRSRTEVVTKRWWWGKKDQ